MVVIDNASIHNTREEGTPKVGSYKAHMQEWLMEKGVAFDPKEIKRELWEKIKERLKTCPDYSIDKLAAEIRPDVIIERLPPYHCDMNAIEPVWSIPKAEAAKSPHKNIHDVKQIVDEAFDNLDDEYVRNCIDHVREQEDYYRYLHGKKPLNVEPIEMVDDFDDQPEVVEEPTEDPSAFAFNEEGQILAPIEENVEIIETSVTHDSYICEPCGFTTISPGQWSRHLKGHHECDVCRKTFHGVNGLRDFKTHLKTHQPKQSKKTGPKKKGPFACQECGKSVPFLSYLKRHMKRAHGAQKSVLHVTVGGSTTDEKNPGQISAEGSAALATVGGPTTEEKHPGQSSAEDSALFIKVQTF